MTPHKTGLSMTSARLLRLAGLIACLGGLLLWYNARSADTLAAAKAKRYSDPAAAENLAWKAVSRQPQRADEAHWFLTQLYARQDRLDEALAAFDLVREPGKLPEGELAAMAEELNQKEASVLAIRLLTAAIHRETAEDEIRGVRRLVAAIAQRGDLIDTYEFSRRLIELTPDDPLPWALLGKASHGLGLHADSVKFLRECLKRNPPEGERPKLLEELVEVLIHLGKHDEALEEIQRAREGGISTRTLQLHEAYALRLKGNRDEALGIVEGLMREGFRKEQALQLRGMLRFDDQKWEAAAEDFRALLAITPRNKEAEFLLGQSLQRLGRTAEARPHLLRAEALARSAAEILALQDQLRQNPEDQSLRTRIEEIRARPLPAEEPSNTTLP